MKKFLALLLALVMTMSLVTVGASAKTAFTDDKDITEVEAVEVLSAMGIIDGYKDGSFKPQAVLNRGAGAKFIAYLMLGEKAADGLKATGTLFEDVAADYALAPYIEYCAKMGYVDGYGNGKFGPTNALTQAAFGKMLLTALGYDSAAEGYTGAGWQKAVYAQGFKVGVYGEDGEIYAACNRETAAAMALGALLADMVEYGKTVAWKNGKTLVTENGAVVVYGDKRDTSTNPEDGLQLWETYKDLEYKDNCDAFGRPGHEWVYGKDFDKFYMDAPVKEYEEKVSACDLLVDLGIAKTSKNDIKYLVIENGGEVYQWNTLDHKTCTNVKFGGQGALTQVFELENKDGDTYYVITVINTYLAKVAKVKEVKHGAEAEVTFALYNSRNGELGLTTTVKDDLGLAKGDYVLLTRSDDELNVECEVYYGDVYETDHNSHFDYVGLVGAADSKTGKLDGFNETKDQTRVDGTWYDNAVKFFLGYLFGTEVDFYKNNDTKFTFYFDQYGNVIGAVPYEADDVYAVIDAIGFERDYKGITYYGDFYGFDAKEIVTKGEVAVKDGKLGNTRIALDEFADNNSAKYDDIYKYEVNSDDEYELEFVVAGETFRSYADKTFTFGGNFDRRNRLVNTETAYVDNDTVILVRDAAGAYTSYTGYKAMKDLVDAETVAVVYADATKTVAEYVFVTGAYFKGDSVTGFLFDVGNNWAGEYNTVNVWLGTKETEVLIANDAYNTLDKVEDLEGMIVEFTIMVDEDNNLVASDVKPAEYDVYKTLTFYTDGFTADYHGDHSSKLVWVTYGEDVEVYLVKSDEVVEYDMETAADQYGEEIGVYCWVIRDDDGKVASIYFAEV